MITLLKIDSADKIRVITLESSDTGIQRTAGVYGGNLIETFTPTAPKNVGKINETTRHEQAELEIRGIVNEKCNEGYVNATEYVATWGSNITGELLDFIQKNQTKAPQAMLAKQYEEKYADFKGGVLCSPKLDGMRCMAVIPVSGPIVLWSRGGKQIDTMGHIIRDLELIRANGFTGILDGELYYHDKGAENFQDIMKAIKKYRPGISENVQYWVYDVVEPLLSAEFRARCYGQAINTVEGKVTLFPMRKTCSL